MTVDDNSGESIEPPLSARLERAAFSVVDGALSVVPGERVVVVVDRHTLDFGHALCRVVRRFHADPSMFCLEDFGERPHPALHDTIRDAFEGADASVMSVSFHRGEFPMRSELVDTAAFGKLRHAHMIGVSKGSLLAGLVAEPGDIARLSRAIRIRILPDSTIRVRSARGTDLAIRVAPWCRWYETSGVIQPGTKANLPAGELVTSPDSVDGVYVADGSLADASGELNGDLRNAPLFVHFESGHVRYIDSMDAERSSRIRHQVERTENLDRVGLVNFGTNLGMTEPAEDIFTSQKLPGLHLSLGLSFPQRTGAQWNAMDWIALTTTRCDIDIDGVPLMREGRYLV